MKFESKYNPIFGFTAVSDIFFTDYLPELDGDSAKLYFACLYLNHRNREVTLDELAKGLEESIPSIEEKLIYLETAGLIARINDNIILQDLNQKELDRLYRSRTPGAMSDEFTLGRTVITKRTNMVKSISDKFFAGQMPPSWYTEIDLWFDKYGFEPEVMYMLFQHCTQNHVVTKPYVRKVAESWGEKEIHTADQLEEYLTEYDRFKDAKGQVIKKLRLNSNIDTYSEDILKKWFMKYGYTFEIVELALQNAPKAKNPTLKYFDTIISSWHEAGLKDKEQIEKYEAARKSLNKGGTSSKTGGASGSAAQKNNYKGRDYDSSFLDGLYKDVEDEN